ncbi:hypothetical protein QYE76_017813 [Lolium multiflorum]|uniref:Uncharacterized protein n=1 Tax=Lolium multiflorum TaxID=4521 RepID=A0AAD8QI13_LOLMU|nr:hypothetical protein QYE76_017813 [Lolium multiflorum]
MRLITYFLGAHATDPRGAGPGRVRRHQGLRGPCQARARAEGSGHQAGGRGPLHPPELDEEEVLKLALEQSDLEEFTRWDGLRETLRQSELAQQRLATPLVTPPC